MLKHLDRLDSLKLKHRKVYEPWETGIMKANLKRNQVFIDIGAHIGYYTLMAAAIVGDGGAVFAFEPSPENFSVLKNNVAAAGCKSVFLYNEAVSIKTGFDFLYLNPKNTGDNRLFNPGQPWQKIGVKTTRLDDMLDAYSGRVDFIKIDAQGHELSILRGMEKTLERFPAVKMLLEYFPLGLKQSGEEPTRLLKELKGLGFKLEYAPGVQPGLCTADNGKHCNIFMRRGI